MEALRLGASDDFKGGMAPIPEVKRKPGRWVIKGEPSENEGVESELEDSSSPVTPKTAPNVSATPKAVPSSTTIPNTAPANRIVSTPTTASSSIVIPSTVPASRTAAAPSTPATPTTIPSIRIVPTPNPTRHASPSVSFVSNDSGEVYALRVNGQMLGLPATTKSTINGVEASARMCAFVPDADGSVKHVRVNEDVFRLPLHLQFNLRDFDGSKSPQTGDDTSSGDSANSTANLAKEAAPEQASALATDIAPAREATTTSGVADADQTRASASDNRCATPKSMSPGPVSKSRGSKIQIWDVVQDPIERELYRKLLGTDSPPAKTSSPPSKKRMLDSDVQTEPDQSAEATKRLRMEIHEAEIEVKRRKLAVAQIELEIAESNLAMKKGMLGEDERVKEEGSGGAEE